METDDLGTRFMRGGVKLVFIMCYIAFMWASIHHVAAFFNDFEADSGNSVGSYMLAGAFDITALVTTMGVMFFRKSMPLWVLCIVWTFILAITGYSFFINWEYASHYQSMTLLMQPTGVTTPIYDAHGVLHYVPEMRINTSLIYVNPIVDSGFTFFALIYSVIAEFFGAKPPTAEELLSRKEYLEQTQGIRESIKQLEGKGKGPSIFDRTKNIVKESKGVINELRKKEETGEETPEKTERNADETEMNTDGNEKETPEKTDSNAEGNTEETEENPSGNQTEAEEESEEKRERKTKGNTEENTSKYMEGNLPSWLSTGGSTVSLDTVVKETQLNRRKLNNRVESHVIRATKRKDIVYKDSLIQWMKAEGIIQEADNIVDLNERRNEEENQLDKLAITLEALKENSEITDEELAGKLHLSRPASARFWKLKAEEILRMQVVNE